MLFVNLDLITELLGHNIPKHNQENKLQYYDDIAATTLEEDISFTSREEAVINNFFEIEIYQSSLIGKNISENIRKNHNLSLERERVLFTKLFTRDYLVEKAGKSSLSVENYLSNKELFAPVAIEEIKNKLTAIKLFEDFASDELKNDKDFAKVILNLNGTHITSMGEIVRNSAKLMEIAIANDNTEEVVSFTNSNSKLLNDSDMAILYFKSMKENQEAKFSSYIVYEDIFKQENGEYPKKIFKNDEQSSWIEDSAFLPRLAKISNIFLDLIATGDIGPLSSQNNKNKIKSKQ